MKITKILILLLVGIISSFFFVNKVNAYVTVTSDPAINRFTIASNKQVTYVYSYIDENSVKHTLAPTEVVEYFGGTVITLADRIDNNVDYDQVRIHINDTTYTDNTYTVSDNVTIEYVYYLNIYSITYNLVSGTLNNQINSYTSMTETFDLPTPTRNNYIFDGWCNGNTNCSNPSKPYTVTQGSTGNITVRAQWHQKQNFRVTYAGDTNRYSHTPTGSYITTPEGEDFTTTIRLSSNDYSIESVTISMNNQQLESGEGYTYSGSGRDYSLTIYNVSGPININVQVNTDGGGGCLAEGTKIMLWDGSYKNIEDITYNDLLKVWNHETGTYGYEYPAWIENRGTATKYTKVTFSDGSELKIVFEHRVFSRRLNKYVNINSDELQVGDEVVSLEDGINYVTVTSKEIVYEDINYYHVITSRYFNMIANGILTTYEVENDISSNYKGFTDGIIWLNQTPEDRKQNYEEFINTFGYVDKYLFKTLKLEDFKYAAEEGFLTREELESIITEYMMNSSYRELVPTNDEGQYLWMVATSDDEDPSDTVHQMVEGSIYTVPTPINEENFLHWYNHSDNKYYQPGDEIEVDSSMYLEAIYN